MASNARFNPDDPLELAAARMSRFLARNPRSAKTRAYLASLPPRKKGVAVSPADYPRPLEPEAGWRERILRELRDAQRYADWEARGKPPSPSLPAKTRKDRRRPRVVGSETLRVRLYEAQDGLCGLCGGEMGPHDATIDHVVPRAHGGRNAGNVLLAHSKCNEVKGSRPPRASELALLAKVNARLAQAGEAGTAETTKTGSVHGHATNGDAPKPYTGVHNHD